MWKTCSAGRSQCRNRFFIEMFMLMWSLFALEIILELLDTAGEVSGVCVNAKTMF